MSQAVSGQSCGRGLTHGTEIAWRVTFKKDVTMEGHTFLAGDTFQLDPTLRKSGGSWLIDGM